MSEPRTRRRGTWWVVFGLLVTFVALGFRAGLPIYRRKLAIEAMHRAGLAVTISATEGKLAKAPWLAAMLSDEWRTACGEVTVVGVRRYSFTSLLDKPLQTRRNLEPALRAFRELSEVRLIVLSDVAELGDDDLVHLSHLRHLEVLNLDATAVSNAGLTHLAKLPGLRELSVSSTHVTDLGLEELRRTHPDLEVTDD
jgi:hypothetical protein